MTHLNTLHLRMMKVLLDRPEHEAPLVINRTFYDGLTPEQRDELLPKNIVISPTEISPADTIVACATVKSSHGDNTFPVDPQKSAV